MSEFSAAVPKLIETLKVKLSKGKLENVLSSNEICYVYDGAETDDGVKINASLNMRHFVQFPLSPKL